MDEEEGAVVSKPYARISPTSHPPCCVVRGEGLLRSGPYALLCWVEGSAEPPVVIVYVRQAPLVLSMLTKYTDKFVLDPALATLANLVIPDGNGSVRTSELVDAVIAAATSNSELLPIVEKSLALLNNFGTFDDAGMCVRK